MIIFTGIGCCAIIGCAIIGGCVIIGGKDMGIPIPYGFEGNGETTNCAGRLTTTLTGGGKYVTICGTVTGITNAPEACPGNCIGTGVPNCTGGMGLATAGCCIEPGAGSGEGEAVVAEFSKAEACSSSNAPDTCI